MKYTISYAQNFEDLVLDAFFPDVENGYYVDIGAFHPMVDSVTKLFYLRGWRGINIEPQKNLFDALLLDRPEDTNLQLGLAARPGTLTFNQYSMPGLSTFSASVEEAYAQDRHSVTGEAKRQEIKVDTLANVLAAHPLPRIHFLKVDVEGFEYEVLQGNDWNRFRPEVLCIESDHIVKDWHELLAQQGYEHAHSDGLNEYFVSPQAHDRAVHFQEHFIDRVVKSEAIKFRHYERIITDERKIRSLQAQVDLSARENEHLRAQLNSFRHQIWLPHGIRRQVIELARSIDRSILWRLELWEYNPQEKRSRNMVPGDVKTSSHPEKLLAAIRAVDLASYWDSSRVPTAPRILRAVYKALWRLLGRTSEFYRALKASIRSRRRGRA